MESRCLEKFADLTGKLALELVFAEPGKDNGLLPVNSLLGQIEEEAAAVVSMPSPLPEAIKIGRCWVDGVFESNCLFDKQSIQRLSDWVQWMQNAWEAVKSGQPLAEIPETWSAPSTPDNVLLLKQEEKPISGDETPLVMNLEQDADLLREFINESQEHLQNIETGVLVLEDNPADADTLSSIFRAFHTFKGGSGLLDLTPINRLAHELESLLDLARQDKLRITSDIIDLILAGEDLFKQFIQGMERQLAGQTPPGPISIPIQGLVSQIKAAIQGSVSGTQPLVTPEKSVALPSVAATLEEIGTAPDETKAAVDSAKQESRVHAKSTTAASFVKVDTQKLDALVDMVGEMVIAQSQVAQDPDLLDLKNQRLARNMCQLGRITNELQRTAMSLRMVPVRSTFQKMTRLVRDLAARQGKSIEFTMSGEDTELDRTIVDELNDPLIHMVRNSVDHGIEPPDTRLSQGKPPQGRIHLQAFHQGGNIVIEMRDDGAGLNKQRILNKAIEKGLVPPNQNLSEKEIFNLIFAPGFSTADKITDISGRGVGMDVVRQNIEKLRGKIDIDSVEGQGTTITSHLPLTLAIIDGLIVGVGRQRYIIPTLSVRESFRPQREMITSVHGRAEMVNVRGRLSPLLRLHDYFGVEPLSSDPTQGIVVVLESNRETRCLLIDQLLGKQEVVIKSLGDTFKRNPAVAGAAILGDGRVGLILDANALVKLKTSAQLEAA